MSTLACSNYTTKFCKNWCFKKRISCPVANDGAFLHMCHQHGKCKHDVELIICCLFPISNFFLCYGLRLFCLFEVNIGFLAYHFHWIQVKKQFKKIQRCHFLCCCQD